MGKWGPDQFLAKITKSLVACLPLQVGGSTSGELPVLSGVPQGSILGPTLFVLYLNDIVSDFSTGNNIVIHADDTKI